MIQGIIAYLVNLIIHIISSLGYAGVVLLMAMHSSAIPVPSEVVMPFTGFLVSTGRFNFYLAVLAGTFGNLIGGSFIYFIVRRNGKIFVEKFGKYVFLSMSDVKLAEDFFNKFGSWAIFLGRCIPIVATFISIPAGLARVKYWKFAVFTFLGASIWNVILVYIGLQLGENWLTLREKLKGLEIFIAIIIFAGAVFWIWKHLKGRKK